MMAVAALFAMVGAFGSGYALGSRRERAVAQADVAMWRTLANELHAENGNLRCEDTSVPASGEPPFA
jgi:hypothetical protein